MKKLLIIVALLSIQAAHAGVTSICQWGMAEQLSLHGCTEAGQRQYRVLTYTIVATNLVTNKYTVSEPPRTMYTGNGNNFSAVSLDNKASDAKDAVTFTFIRDIKNIVPAALEIDASLAGLGVSLLCGILFLLNERRRPPTN